MNSANHRFALRGSYTMYTSDSTILCLSVKSLLVGRRLGREGLGVDEGWMPSRIAKAKHS